MGYSLSVENISKKYDDFYAVRGLSLRAAPGTIYGLLGPNGAGKTTTIRMVMNILMPDEGQILVFGEPMREALKRRIGYLPEERGLYQKMKVYDQLLFLAQLKGLTPARAAQRLDEWLARMQFSEWKNHKVEELSKGMQQKVQFIATVAHDPDLIILDEPFAGLDPINAHLLEDIIVDLKKQGKTILFSTHRMEQVERLCDHICLVNRGTNILEGPLRAIKQQYRKNTILLEYQGSLAFLEGDPAVRRLDDFGTRAEVRLTEEADPHEFIRAVVARVQVYKFEIVEPSLNDIFIEKVGQSHA